jgi:hypothetical protein
MTDLLTFIKGNIKVPADFPLHLQNFLGRNAALLILERMAKESDDLSILPFYYEELECTLDLKWEKSGTLFSLLAVIKPTKSSGQFGDVYPYMLPPVYTDDEQAVSKGLDIENEFHLHSLQPEKFTWIYVYNSNPSHTETLDGWLKEPKNVAIPEELNACQKLQTLNKHAKDSLSLEAWHGGLYLFGTLGLLSVIPNKEDFKTYFGAASPSIPFYGFLHYPLYFPYLTIHLPIVSDKGSGSFKLNELYVELSSPTYYMPGQTEIGFGAELAIGDETLNIKAIWPLAGDRIKAIASISGPIPFLDTHTLPGLGNFKPSAELTAELILSISEKSVKSLKLELELANWVLIENVLTLEDLDFSITIIEPGSQNWVLASIRASALLGSSGIRLTAMGEYPSGLFSFSLDPNTPIHINQLLAAFTGKNPSLDGELVIDQFEGWVNYTSGEASFSTGVSGHWKPGFMGIELTGLHFNISKNENWSFGVWSTFKLHEVDFEVAALYNDGWFFSAKANQVLFGKFLKNMSGDTTLPSSIESMVLSDLLFEFNTNGGDYKIGGKGKLSLNGIKIEAEILVTASHKNDQKEKAFSGRLIILGKYFFDLKFEQDGKNSSIQLAAFHDEGTAPLELIDLLKGLGIEPAPPIHIEVKDAVLFSGKFPGKIQNQPLSNNLFIADIQGGINLSNLPLVGHLFEGDNSIKLAFHIQWAKDIFDENAVSKMNAMLPAGIPPIAVKVLENSDQKGLKKGLGLAINMQLGTQMIPLDFPLKVKENAKKTQAKSAKSSDSSTPKTADQQLPKNQPLLVADESESQEADIKWFSVQKGIGPVYFNRVGVGYQKGLFSFYIDASLSIGGMTLSLSGLSATSPIDKFDPSFDLKGLGLSFANGPLEIGGSFLREKVLRNGEAVDDYSGTATIRTEAFSLMAMGGYTTLNGHPSLFLYAILDKQIGGPAFFFVEGLAAGFGFNRKLIIPNIDNIESFPLIEAAMAGMSSETIDPTAELEKLKLFIPPSTGDIFLAIGVKFNSFKQVHSFALLSLSFGHRVELHLLGISNLLVPSVVEDGQSPIARIEMVLSGVFIPEEGFLGIQTQLTSKSYILSEKCTLTGGFAFFSWFSGKHSGDFIVTLGGYHTDFNPPEHYPQHVPRLGFNWKVDSHTIIKGEAYYALCSHAFMVGGHLEATYQSGSFAACFKAGADFLISWKPYHYDAHIYVDISASYTYHFFGTHHISMGLGADIHLSGPEFGGTARVHIWVVSITVHFGASKGGPKPIEWTEFRNSFLPEKDKVISVTINKGLVKSTKKTNHLGVVNPKLFALTVDSAIPSNSISVTGEPPFIGNSFGIGSMGISKIDSAHQTITIKNEKGKAFELEIEALHKKVPAGIWGSKLLPGVNDAQHIEALTGVIIHLKKQKNASHTKPVRRRELMTEDYKIFDSFSRQKFSFPSGMVRNEDVYNLIDAEWAKENRRQLLTTLGVDIEVDLKRFTQRNISFTNH